MGGYAVVSLEDRYNGNAANVGRDGALKTTPGAGDTGNQTRVLTSTWVEILAENAGRRQVQIQNQSPTVAVFIQLVDSLASVGSYRIDPGATYSFPPGVAWRGKIHAMANPGADVVVIEFSEPVEDES